VDDLLPVLEEIVTPDLDVHGAQRLTEMSDRYADVIARRRG
jgi:hypothetical protein